MIHNSYNKGFTLVETIVAIGVISIGFVGSLVLLSKSASQASTLKDRLIAAHLAEEGIEVVRNLRDTNWLKGFDWRADLDDTNFALVNYNSPAIGIDIDGNVLSQDCLSYVGGFYAHLTEVSSCNTSFKRYIEITTKDDPDLIDPDTGKKAQYMEVKSVVSWREKVSTKSLTVIDNLYDWK